MKKIQRPKLHLAQETVRSLSDADLMVIVGGLNPISNRSDCNRGTCFTCAGG